MEIYISHAVKELKAGEPVSGVGVSCGKVEDNGLLSLVTDRTVAVNPNIN